MRARKRNVDEATPIHNRQRKLAEEQSLLREKMAQLEQFVADAPRRAQEEEKRRREELIARASQGERPSDSVGALKDKLFDLHTSAAPRTGKRKGLRYHRQAAKLQFFVLLVLLAVLVIVLLSRTSWF